MTQKLEERISQVFKNIEKIYDQNKEIKSIISKIKFYQKKEEISICNLEKMRSFFKEDESDFLINNFFLENDQNKVLIKVIDNYVYLTIHFNSLKNYSFKYLDFKRKDSFYLLKNHNEENFNLFLNFKEFILGNKRIKGYYFDNETIFFEKQYQVFLKKFQERDLDEPLKIFQEYLIYQIGLFLDSVYHDEKRENKILNLNSYWETFKCSTLKISNELQMKFLDLN